MPGEARRKTVRVKPSATYFLNDAKNARVPGCHGIGAYHALKGADL
jgi:hypothetical protein